MGMNFIFFAYFALLGIIIGSFLNVVIYRYNTGRTILGRSQCFSCRRTLRWYDMIPLFSFLFNRGRCRTCKSKLSWQYPLVELATGVLFVLVYSRFASLANQIPVLFVYQVVYYLIQMCLLVVIFVYDLRHKIIPNALVYAFSLIALVHLFFGLAPMGGLQFSMPSFMCLAAGPILAFPFYLVWLLSRGKWMGLGDAKLALGMGWFLGLSAGGSAIMIGFWVGAVVSVFLLLLKELFAGARSKTLFGIRLNLPELNLKSEIPFAPFLIIGLLIAFIFGYNVFAHLVLI